MKYIIFGSGQLANFIIDKVNYIEMFLYVVDNNEKKCGNYFRNLIIKNPIELKYESLEDKQIVIASSFYNEIKSQLESYGFKEGIEFINYDLFLDTFQSDEVRIIQYPIEINYPITNKCNFRCAMCNVWKPEYAGGKDMTPSEINNLFSKKLFKQLQHVGISGGEPFVRRDILEVIQSIVKAIPNLKSISIITNCSIKGMLDKVKEIKEYLLAQNIIFTLQVSIDGIGEIHNKNRGRKNAFDLMYVNFKELLSYDVINEISTTITKNNINHLWETYYFARKHGIYIRYRLATKIERLYNEDLVQNFSFNEIEKLKLIKFFENLIGNYEQNLKKKVFYLSLIKQLKGEDRTAGCTYQTSKGVSLDPYGNLHFCFPNSEKISNINNEIEYDLDFLEENIKILERAKLSCKNCIHDYTGPYNNLELELLNHYLNKNKRIKENNLQFLKEYNAKEGQNEKLY